MGVGGGVCWEGRWKGVVGEEGECGRDEDGTVVEIVGERGGGVGDGDNEGLGVRDATRNDEVGDGDWRASSTRVDLEREARFRAC